MTLQASLPVSKETETLYVVRFLSLALIVSRMSRDVAAATCPAAGYEDNATQRSTSFRKLARAAKLG